MTEELNDFVNGLYAETERTKEAAQNFDHLTIAELEVILGLESAEKVAFGAAEACTKESSEDDFLSSFRGTPLHAKAIALCEDELKAEQENLRLRMQRQKDRAIDRQSDSIWDTKDAIRVKKKMLSLQLHKLQLGGEGEKGEAEKAAGEVEYTGSVNTGEAQAPAWPRAALGLDSASRPATLTELKAQDDTATPQHVEPKTAGLQLLEAIKTAKDKGTPYAALGTGLGTLLGLPLVGSLVGGAAEGERVGEAGQGALRSAGGAVLGSLGGGVALGAGGALLGAIGGQESAVVGAAIGATIGAIGGQIVGAHKATARYRTPAVLREAERRKAAGLSTLVRRAVVKAPRKLKRLAGSAAGSAAGAVAATTKAVRPVFKAKSVGQGLNRIKNVPKRIKRFSSPAPAPTSLTRGTPRRPAPPPVKTRTTTAANLKVRSWYPPRPQSSAR